MKLSIRPLRTHDEFRAAEELQKQVWEFSDREIVPLNELVIAQKIGGVVLGAFDPNERLVAFCFGVPALDPPNRKKFRLYHHSRMLGVLPEFRNQGVGFRLKLAQREAVLAQGIDRIRWTFDPLQGRNAFFNLEKLGAVVREYAVNLYGADSTSRFNVGMETDRFYADWALRSPRVLRAIRGERPPASIEILKEFAPALEAVFSGDSPPRPDLGHLRVSARRVSVEIPDPLEKVRSHSQELARQWRLETRKVFQHLLARSYVITGYVSGEIGGRHRGFYLLEKMSDSREA